MAINNVTDGKPKIGYPFAHAVLMPIATTAQLGSGNSNVNHTGHTDKTLGSCVLQLESDGHSIVMALGDEPVSKWANVTKDAEDITPSDYSLSAGSSFGDAKPKIQEPIIGSLDFPVVLKDDLANGNHFINHNDISGKKIGAAVIMKDGEKYALCIAGGYMPTDKWYPAYGAAITPSAETAVAGPFDKKPKLVNGTVAAIPFPAVKLGDLQKAAHPVNAGDGVNFNGKQPRAMVVVQAADLRLSLMMATGFAPADKWVVLQGDDATGAVTPA